MSACLSPFFTFLLLSGFNVANWFHFLDTNVDQPVRNSVAHTTLRSKKLYYWVRHMQLAYFVHTHTVILILIYSDTECEQSLIRQGMTIRIAWLPWASNLLGQASDNLSRADQPICCQFFSSIDSIMFQFMCWISSHCGSFRFAVPLSHQFLSSIKPTDLCVVACEWLVSAVKPIRS